jgi:NhaA family Na+:H+ antiporter
MIVLSHICLLILFVFNRLRVESLAPYLWVGAFLWIFVLKSGVHATLAGVALAFAIPLHKKDKPEESPLEDLEHSLAPWVSFMILPVFAFANAGISLSGMEISDLFSPVPLGIMLGLIVGKLVGVYGFSMAAIKMGFAKLPEGAANQHILGVAALCGIGFTMSLFVGGLAFEHTGGDAVAYLSTHRLGILTGSLLAGLAGYFILSMPVRKATVSEVEKVVDKEPPTVKL